MSLAEKEIEIESPSNTVEVKKEEQKETKDSSQKNRKKKEKKKVAKVERPKLIKYTVKGNVKNSSGRYRFIDIIDAENEQLATDIYKQRAKKELSGVRSITKVEVCEYKSGDIRSVDLIEDTVIPTVTKSMSIEDIALNILKTTLTISKSNVYKITYSPSKKKSVLKRLPKLYLLASDESDMLNQLKSNMQREGIPFMKSYVSSSLIKSDVEYKESHHYKTILDRVKSLNSDYKDKLNSFYTALENNEVPSNYAEMLLEIPKLITGDEFDEYLARKSKDDSPIESCNLDKNIKDLVVEEDNKTGKLIKIYPNKPLMNMSSYNKYTIKITSSGNDIVCSDVYASDDKLAMAYLVKVATRKRLIKSGAKLVFDVISSKGEIIHCEGSVESVNIK